MATLSGVFSTIDAVNRTDPFGKMYRIAEMLETKSDFMSFMNVIPSNLPTQHVSALRSGEPTIYKRRFNEGTLPSKSTVFKVTDGMTMLEGRSHLDERLVDIMGEGNELRLSEARPFFSAMSKEANRQAFYGSVAVDDKEFNGIQPRYNDLDADNADQIINAGGTGGGSVYTSVYLIATGPGLANLLYPKNSSFVGLRHSDLGKGLVADSTGIAGAQLLAWRDQWNWDLGLAVEDQRAIVRICNIDLAAVAALTGTQALTAGTFLLKLMMDALDRIEAPGMAEGGRLGFFANRSIRSALRNMALNKALYTITMETAEGRPKVSVGGVPVYLCDQIVNTEAEVTTSTVSVGG